MKASAAATDVWTDLDGFRAPAGEVHAWLPGTNQTLCGVPIHRAGLRRRRDQRPWRRVNPRP